MRANLTRELSMCFVASCIGHHFNLAILTRIADTDLRSVCQALWPVCSVKHDGTAISHYLGFISCQAIDAGLIVAPSETFLIVPESITGLTSPGPNKLTSPNFHRGSVNPGSTSAFRSAVSSSQSQSQAQTQITTQSQTQTQQQPQQAETKQTAAATVESKGPVTASSSSRLGTEGMWLHFAHDRVRMVIFTEFFLASQFSC